MHFCTAPKEAREGPTGVTARDLADQTIKRSNGRLTLSSGLGRRGAFLGVRSCLVPPFNGHLKELPRRYSWG